MLDFRFRRARACPTADLRTPSPPTKPGSSRASARGHLRQHRDRYGSRSACERSAVRMCAVMASTTGISVAADAPTRSAKVQTLISTSPPGRRSCSGALAAGAGRTCRTAHGPMGRQTATCPAACDGFSPLPAAQRARFSRSPPLASPCCQLRHCGCGWEAITAITSLSLAKAEQILQDLLAAR